MKILRCWVAGLCIGMLGLTGCSEITGQQNVAKAFPDAEIVRVPEDKYGYIVRKGDGSIWYCRDNGTDTLGRPLKVELLKGKLR
jgi:hypothetical protein